MSRALPGQLQPVLHICRHGRAGVLDSEQVLGNRVGSRLRIHYHAHTTGRGRGKVGVVDRMWAGCGYVCGCGHVIVSVLLVWASILAFTYAMTAQGGHEDMQCIIDSTVPT